MIATPETTNPTKSAAWRLKTTFWLDAVLLVSFCALQTIRFTGLLLHEWIGLGMIALVCAHLLFSWSWIASLTRRLLSRQPIRARVNYLLNVGLFAAITAAIFSGILISRYAIPALTGAQAAPRMDWRWDRLHNLFSQFLLILSAFHLAMNWDWARAAAARLFAGQTREVR